MSIVTDHWRWLGGITDCGGYGASYGDTFHQGMRNYDSDKPCPNGLGVRDTKPSDHEPWRRRIAKAKRDIGICQRDVRVRERADQITIIDLQNDIKEIRQWAISLRKRT